MRQILHMIAVLALCLAFASVPRAAFACGVCVELPEYSLADRILSARVLVLAAPSPENPFRFVPVSTLKGTSEQIEALPKIPFLVDSVTRSAFRADPNRAVLMIYGSGYRDKAGRGGSSSWTKAFLMTSQRAQFLDALRVMGKDWSDKKARVAFFSPYLTHEDRLLRNAALIELHRAPYHFVAHLTDVVPPAQLLQEMRNPNRLAYAPAFIRLLGLQSDPQAKDRVRLRYQDALRSGTLNLYDWALAGIEVDRTVAVSRIESALARPDRSPDERRLLIRSLADGGTAHPELQPEILNVYKRQLEADNTLAIWIALAVKPWGTDVLTPAFEGLMASDALDPAAEFLIRATLAGDVPG
ncbi:hypothetical protein [Ruegeria sp. R14_0]|uniref:hypothetical protein n=1 Tax=Ruegeria sp. R14_0 TaxID=2821100 RepID=UPI001ADBD9EF|nr:hypothetical protein [Ruegeria sp. R14_0]MBO9445739.1 hypothetical protein [Ruegeria sp. R14_0]